MNDADSPQGQDTGERGSCEHDTHECPKCGAIFSDGTDYEDGDYCMPCTEQWLETWFNENRVALKQAVAILKQRKQWL